MKNKKQKTSKKPQPVKKQRLWEDDWWMEDSEPVQLTLRFSPTAWAKLLYFRDQSDNEVGGFGITDPDDLLFVQDVVAVKQEVTSISVKFDDEAVSKFFDEQVDLGRKPEQFARLWLHILARVDETPATVWPSGLVTRYPRARGRDAAFFSSCSFAPPVSSRAWTRRNTSRASRTKEPQQVRCSYSRPEALKLSSLWRYH